MQGNLREAVEQVANAWFTESESLRKIKEKYFPEPLSQISPVIYQYEEHNERKIMMYHALSHSKHLYTIKIASFKFFFIIIMKNYDF